MKYLEHVFSKWLRSLFIILVTSTSVFTHNKKNDVQFNRFLVYIILWTMTALIEACLPRVSEVVGSNPTGPTKDLKISICCFSFNHAALKSKEQKVDCLESE